MLHKKDYQPCLDYIKAYFDDQIVSVSEDAGMHIGLPHPFVSPNKYIFAGDQFYWDTYFTILGLLDLGYTSLCRGMVDNFTYLFRRFGIIPMRNRFYNVGVSQPPFLTTMIREVYAYSQDKDWLRETTIVATRELQEYWMTTREQVPEIHMIHDGLSRYCDHFITHLTAEHESGWDMTSRFGHRALHVLPVDLNALLYKYEGDLAWMYRELGDESLSVKFAEQAALRQRRMDQYMWNEELGFFFDYNWFTGTQNSFWSLAGFYPLWAGSATSEQAQRVVGNLHHFEFKGGMATTQREVDMTDYHQWDYPNGWAPLQWIVCKGLLNYGYREEAERIAKKWLDLNKKLFEETGKFWEKYDVVDQSNGKEGRYPHQHGFAWTNAVFVRLLETFGS